MTPRQREQARRLGRRRERVRAQVKDARVRLGGLSYAEAYSLVRRELRKAMKRGFYRDAFSTMTLSHEARDVD